MPAASAPPAAAAASSASAAAAACAPVHGKLECCVCAHEYTGAAAAAAVDHTPRVLSCGHGLCTDCAAKLIRHGAITCPRHDCARRHAITLLDGVAAAALVTAADWARQLPLNGDLIALIQAQAVSDSAAASIALREQVAAAEAHLQQLIAPVVAAHREKLRSAETDTAEAAAQTINKVQATEAALAAAATAFAREQAAHAAAQATLAAVQAAHAASAAAAAASASQADKAKRSSDLELYHALLQDTAPAAASAAVAAAAAASPRPAMQMPQGVLSALSQEQLRHFTRLLPDVTPVS